jgi:hypothetical protein
MRTEFLKTSYMLLDLADFLRNHTKSYFKNLKGRGHLRYLDVGGKIIL